MRDNFSPFFSRPIEEVNGVVTGLVGASSSEHDDPIVDLVVGKGAVGAPGGDCSSGLNFGPVVRDGVEGPEVIHIDGV